MEATVSFKVSSEVAQLITAIIDRTEAAGITKPEDRLTHEMDLTACHANGCELRLVDMLQCERDFDLAHDIYGINHRICRNTGKLVDNFLPRFSAH